MRGRREVGTGHRSALKMLTTGACEAVTAVTMKILSSVVWYIEPGNDPLFRITRQLPSLIYSYTLKLETSHFFETLVHIYQTTRGNIAEGSKLKPFTEIESKHLRTVVVRKVVIGSQN
jgi:hypothetical protein